MASHRKDFDDETDLRLPPVPWGWLGFSLLMPWIFLPLALIFGWAEGGMSPVASAVGALGSTVLFWGLIHVGILYPLCVLVFSQYGDRWGAFERVAAGLGLVAPPVLSFLFYKLGSGLTDGWDLTLMVVPAVLLGAVAYERCQRTWVYSGFVALSVALPWVWVGDRLGGFTPFFTYGVLNSDFQILRTAFLVAGALAAVIWVATRRPLDGSWFQAMGKILAAVLGFHLTLGIVLPLSLRIFRGLDVVPHPHWPLLGYPFLILACRRWDRTPPRWLRGGVAVVAAAEAGMLLFRTWGLKAEVGPLAQWAVCGISTAAVGILFGRLWARGIGQVSHQDRVQ